uniref:Amine oxidase n=1 Tax=Poecilia latipinna TaxID=48699 RepID=A0A3B3VYT5_9TELE
MTADIWDVVIVGAGLSGLSAAHLLTKRDAKLRILILEGKDRVGGRTVSFEIPAADGADRWDFGGQWVGSTQTHIMELIKELGLEVYPQFNVGKKVLHVGGPTSKVRSYRTSIPALSPLVLLDFTQMLWKVRVKLCRTVSVQDPLRTPNAAELDSMTVHSYIEQHAWTEELKEQLGVCSRSVFGVEPSQMSFLFFLMYAAAAGGLLALLESSPGCAQEFKIKGGTQQLSECLAQRVGWKNVRLGSAVTAIWQVEYSNLYPVFVHPPAKIQYQPALPSMREFLTQNMPVGHIMKFILTYQTAFWKEKGFSGEIVAGSSTDCPFCVTFDATSPRGNPALVGFISGQQATLWKRRAAVLSSLVKYLGPEAASCIHYEEKDWAKEEFSGGCPVSVMAPGLLTFYHPSLRKPCGRIHWAGTETATLWCGYMSGAVQAGQRAALEVLAEVSHVVLTPEEQESLIQGQTLHRPPKPTALSALLKRLSRKSVLIPALTIGAALLLVRKRDVLVKIQTYVGAF